MEFASSVWYFLTTGDDDFGELAYSLHDKANKKANFSSEFISQTSDKLLNS